MRATLDWLYRASGALAATFIAVICATVVLQVGANIANRVVGQFTGHSLGLMVPSYADFTGFFLVAATFFALPYTLREGGHIRISLLIRHLGPTARRVTDAWCLGAAGVLTGYFAWYAVNLTLESLVFGDRAVGMVALPLWIPQSAMALGSILLLVALLDDLITVLRGHPPSFEGQDKTVAE